MKYTWILLLLLLVGCKTTEKKARGYYLQNQGELAKLCLDCFGDKKEVEYVQGDVILDTLTQIDSVIVNADCPDGAVVSVNCPPNKNVYITEKRIDSVFRDRWQTLAKIKEVESDLEKSVVKIDKLESAKDKAGKSRDMWRSIALWLIAGCGVVILIIVLKNKIWRLL